MNIIQYSREAFVKKIKKIIYPHIVILLSFVPISFSLLIYSLIYLGTNSIISYISYALSFYSLLIFCFRIPNIINYFKKVKNENKYLKRLFNDVHFRINLSLYGTLIINIIYSIFQLGLGFYHNSFWFYSMAIYYFLIALMRFYLVRHTRNYKPGEELEIELKKYRFCGWILLLMNVSVSIIIFFMIYWNRTFVHHEITTIALAAYTFFTFTLAIINLVKYRKYNSPIYIATKSINLVVSSVSMITLETTMLTTFGGNDVPLFRTLILSLSGGAVAIFILIMAILIIVKANRALVYYKK